MSNFLQSLNVRIYVTRVTAVTTVINVTGGSTVITKKHCKGKINLINIIIINIIIINMMKINKN